MEIVVIYAAYFDYRSGSYLLQYEERLTKKHRIEVTPELWGQQHP
jgi:hypothetical protein